MAEGNETRIIVADAVNGARSQPPDQAHEAVLSAELRRPAVQIAAESNPGTMWHQIFTVLLPFDHLDEQRHPFVVIQQPFGTPVEQSVGVEH